MRKYNDRSQSPLSRGSSYSRNSQPKEISGILGKILGNQKIQEKAKSFSFINSWDEVVGEAYARISHPERLVKGVLSVKVIDAAFVQELSMQKTSILEKLVELGYSGAVSDIKFISGNPKDFRR